MMTNVLTAILSLALTAPSIDNTPEAKAREDRPPEITEVLLTRNTRLYNVRLGDVPYGLSRTHVLRFIPRDFGADTISGLRPLACTTCNSTAVVKQRASVEPGFYEATIILNRHPQRKQELGDYEDSFHLLGPGQRPLATLNVRHSTVLSTRVDPNRVLLGAVIPESTYPVTIRKNDSFAIGAIRLDDDRGFQLRSWEDKGESAEILLEAVHTYEDTTVSANLMISTISGEEITMPLSANIREFLRVHPKRLILGVVERGQVPSARIVISSTSPCSVLRCTSDIDQFKANASSDGKAEAVIDVSFPTSDTLRNGPFRKTVEISTSLSTHPISIPVYGTLVDKQAPSIMTSTDAGAATLMKN